MADPKKKIADENIHVYNRQKDRVESYSQSPGFLGTLWEGVNPATSEQGRAQAEAIRKRRAGSS